MRRGAGRPIRRRACPARVLASAINTLQIVRRTSALATTRMAELVIGATCTRSVSGSNDMSVLDMRIDGDVAKLKEAERVAVRARPL